MASESRNWLEMPEEIMGGMILGRLDALEILTNIQRVCTTTWRRICKDDPQMWKMICFEYSFSRVWYTENDSEKLCKQAIDRSSVELIRRICKDPRMWKMIRLDFPPSVSYTDNDFENLTKQAVHRSCGGLIDITLKGFGTDHLLDFISRSSSKLNSLHLSYCYKITGCGLNTTLERLPHLETLKLSNISISAKDIEAIGRNCPHLKYFKLWIPYLSCDGDAHAITNSMPALRRLKLIGSRGDKDGVRAILNGCPHLESLHILNCSYTRLDTNLEKLCRERIKDFKFNRGLDLRDDDALGDYGVSCGSDISAGENFDYYRL
ncbi:hypothetical protein OSB04_001915 [Centaurea solstitialis]|uniref:F-box protein n=1 Tax=Centaurea solstitialis TaxID=347529 RepID=A0AA38TS99_9ASTR|nr:hypothetical protein OSB04_001915 [Centaurea solstitialis]